MPWVTMGIYYIYITRKVTIEMTVCYRMRVSGQAIMVSWAEQTNDETLRNCLNIQYTHKHVWFTIFVGTLPM